MKLLFDQNLSFKLAKKLDDGRSGFTLVTKDVDYYDRSTLLGHPPKVIWLRCGNQQTNYIERLIRSHAKEIRDFDADATVGCLEIY